MALNVGENFKQRWLATPDAVRQTFCDELAHICDLLAPETQIQKWQYQDALLLQKHRQITERAYEKLKQEIKAEQARIAEEQKRKRQAELEQALAKKRAKEQLQLAELEAQERQTEQAQTNYLHQIAQELQQQAIQQSHADIAKYDVSQVKAFNQNPTVDFTSPEPKTVEPTAHSTRINVPEISNPIHEDLQTRLEIEAEYYIEQTLQQLRLKLQAAAREEIEMILAQQNQAS